MQNFRDQATQKVVNSSDKSVQLEPDISQSLDDMCYNKVSLENLVQRVKQNTNTENFQFIKAMIDATIKNISEELSQDEDDINLE